MMGTEPQSSALVVVGEICGGINVELPAQQDMMGPLFSVVWAPRFSGCSSRALQQAQAQ